MLRNLPDLLLEQKQFPTFLTGAQQILGFAFHSTTSLKAVSSAEERSNIQKQMVAETKAARQQTPLTGATA